MFVYVCTRALDLRFAYVYYEYMSGESLHVDQEVQFDPAAFITQYGLEDIVDLPIEAHGAQLTIADAFKCDPFRAMVETMAENLEEIPGGDDILKASIVGMAKKMATSAPDTFSDEVKKKEIPR